MSQSLLQKVFGVSRHYRHVRTDFLWDAVQFYIDLKEQALVCPQCGSGDEVIRKGRRSRCLQTIPIGFKPVFLITEVARCQCHYCDMIFEIHPPLPGRRCAIRASSKSSQIS